MTRLIITPEYIVRRLTAFAHQGYYTGLLRSEAEIRYFERCQFGWDRGEDDGVRLIYTRDIGHHTSGWFKNPEYERCWHLSLSFWAPANLRHGDEPKPHNHREAREWCERFFGDARRMLWIEPPYSPEGKRNQVYHYRLFCDAGWRPIKPHGEVYSRGGIEKGWKSWSELHADDELRHVEHAMGDPG